MFKYFSVYLCSLTPVPCCEKDRSLKIIHFWKTKSVNICLYQSNILQLPLEIWSSGISLMVVKSRTHLKLSFIGIYKIKTNIDRSKNNIYASRMILNTYKAAALLQSILAMHAADIKHLSQIYVTFTASTLLRWVGVIFNLLKPTGYVMHQQFNIQQLYALPTLYVGLSSSKVS